MNHIEYCGEDPGSGFLSFLLSIIEPAIIFLSVLSFFICLENLSAFGLCVYRNKHGDQMNVCEMKGKERKIVICVNPKHKVRSLGF